MTEFRDVLEEITRDLREIFKRLDDLSIGPASIYALPVPGTMYNHLEDDGTAWQSRANLTIAATAHISAHGVRAALANADGLYVPWENGDTDATMRVGSLDISNNQNAIEAFTDSGYGILATSTDTAGVEGSSTTGTGVEGISSSGAGGNFRSATGAGLVVNLTGAGTAIADFNDNGTSVLTIQDGGQSDFSEYIRHLGDTDTYWRFQTDQATLVCGGVTMIDAVEAASDYVQFGADVGIGAVPGNALDIITGATTSSEFHLGEVADEGGYLLSSTDSQFIMSGGAEYVAGSWTARSTTASIVACGSGFVILNADSGLTDGNTFTPTAVLTVTPTRRVGINETSPGATLHADQLSTSAAIPVLTLDQADVDTVLMKIIGTAAAASVDRTLVADSDFGTPGALVGWYQVEIQDDGARIANGDYYVPIYAAPS